MTEIFTLREWRTGDDTEPLVDFAMRVAREGDYSGAGLEPDRDTFRAWLENLDLTHTVMAEDAQGRLVGLAGIVVAPATLNNKVRVASELFWHPDMSLPAHQRFIIMVRLFTAMRLLAKQQGAASLELHVLSNGAKGLERFIRSQGAQLTHQTFILPT